MSPITLAAFVDEMEKISFSVPGGLASNLAHAGVGAAAGGAIGGARTPQKGESRLKNVAKGALGGAAVGLGVKHHKAISKAYHNADKDGELSEHIAIHHLL